MYIAFVFYYYFSSTTLNFAPLVYTAGPIWSDRRCDSWNLRRTLWGWRRRTGCVKFGSSLAWEYDLFLFLWATMIFFLASMHRRLTAASNEHFNLIEQKIALIFKLSKVFKISHKILSKKYISHSRYPTIFLTSNFKAFCLLAKRIILHYLSPSHCKNFVFCRKFDHFCAPILEVQVA